MIFEKFIKNNAHIIIYLILFNGDSQDQSIVKILLKLYKHLLLGADKAGILKNPGNKYKIKGVNKDKAKPISVSVNKRN